jgi:hypothetical protein
MYGIEEHVTPCCATCREYMMSCGEMICTHTDSELYECGEVPKNPTADVCSRYEMSFVAYETAKATLENKAKGKQ